MLVLHLHFFFFYIFFKKAGSVCIPQEAELGVVQIHQKSAQYISLLFMRWKGIGWDRLGSKRGDLRENLEDVLQTNVMYFSPCSKFNKHCITKKKIGSMADV